MRFDDRVVIVTGAGGKPSVGRAHAMLFAERGAKVLVNDVGLGGNPDGSKPASAESVVAEITEAGGEAIANTGSVDSEEGAAAIVQQALDTWGRVDVLVNNAGVGVVGPFKDLTSFDIERLVAVHLYGGIWMTKAVWPHMIDAGYGRIVNTCSGAMYGMDGASVYGAVKFGMYGLTRGTAFEGAEYGIRVNAMSPGAFTNALHPFFSFEDPEVEKAFIEAQPAELVAPAVVYLCHESCEISGMLFDNGGGSVTATFLAASNGYQDRELTPEAVRDHTAEILDQSNLNIITDPTSPNRFLEAASMLVRNEYPAGGQQQRR